MKQWKLAPRSQNFKPPQLLGECDAQKNVFHLIFFTLDKVLIDTLTTLLDLLDEYINGQKLTDKKSSAYSYPPL